MKIKVSYKSIQKIFGPPLSLASLGYFVDQNTKPVGRNCEKIMIFKDAVLL